LSTSVRSVSRESSRGSTARSLPAIRWQTKLANARASCQAVQWEWCVFGGAGSLHQRTLLGAQDRAVRSSVRLMSPRFVKPYRKSDKNDANEAEAICEAVTRTSLRFVPIKSEAQHEVQALHRVREQLLKSRTALVNQVRGLLAEHGIVAPQGIARARRLLLEILADPGRHGLSGLFRETLQEIAERLRFFDELVGAYDDRIERVF